MLFKLRPAAPSLAARRPCIGCGLASTGLQPLLHLVQVATLSSTDGQHLRVSWERTCATHLLARAVACKRQARLGSHSVAEPGDSPTVARLSACAQTSTGRSRCATAGGCSHRRPRLARCRSVVAARDLACASGVTRGRRGPPVRDPAGTPRLAGPVAAAARVPDSRARRGGHRARSGERRYTRRREQRA